MALFFEKLSKNSSHQVGNEIFIFVVVVYAYNAFYISAEQEYQRDGSTMEKSRTKKLLHCALAHFCVFILCIFHLCLPSFFFYYIFLGLQLFITLTSSIITNFKQNIYKINVFIVHIAVGQEEDE